MKNFSRSQTKLSYIADQSCFINAFIIIFKYDLWCIIPRPKGWNLEANAGPNDYWFGSSAVKVLVLLLLLLMLLLRRSGDKVFNECICVCVCVRLSVYLSTSISPEPHTRSYEIFCACCLSPWLGPPPAVVTQSKGEGAVLWVFFPIDNALYSIAFETHTKTAEPIKMPFGLMTQVGHRYHVLDGGPDPPRGRCNFWVKRSSLL